MWQHYGNAVLGIAVMVATFIGLSGATMSWTFGILGLAILVLGLWGAGVTSPTSQTYEHSHA